MVSTWFLKREVKKKKQKIESIADSYRHYLYMYLALVHQYVPESIQKEKNY